MISRIKIEGFLIHKKLDIALTKGINTLRGLNDSGKSSVIRALYWLCHNRPLGLDFINWDCSYARVTLTVDAHTIVRYRSKTKNYYKVDGKKLVSDAPNKGKVPEEVQAILKMGRLNFQNQRDPIFLLGGSGGQISRELNSIINLDVMDSFLANVHSEARQARTEESIIRSRYKEAKRKKKELAWVGELDTDLTHLEGLKERALQSDVELTSLREGVKDVGRLTLTEQRAKEFICAAAKLCTIAENCLREQRDCERLEEARREYEQADRASRKRIPDVELLSNAFEKVQASEQELKELNVAFSELVDVGIEIEECEKEIHRLNKELNQLCNGACPVCGNKL